MSNDPDQSATPLPGAPLSEEAAFDEQLVAYLDGELDDEASHHVETLLTSKPELREQLVRLERTWETLDQLDRSEVDERFTQTTLELVAVAAEEDVQQDQAKAPRRARRRWVLGGIWLAAVAATGFLAVMFFWPDPNRQLLDDLPVIENLEPYRQVDDVEFIRQLAQEDLFPETADDE